MLHDPHLDVREMIKTVDHPAVGPTRVMGTPLKLSHTPAAVRTPPPLLGQHTDTVLGELGYDREMVERLRASGAI